MNDHHLAYVIGEPGVGKTTLVGRLTADAPFEEIGQPFYMNRYGNGVLELGRRRPDFGGTDALPMSIQPACQQWLAAEMPARVLGEGDRLGNDTFFMAAARLGYGLTIYLLEGARLAERRRAERGSDQNATWLKGRRTKVANLADFAARAARGNPAWRLVRLDASLPAATLLTVMDDPVTGAFR